MLFTPSLARRCCFALRLVCSPSCPLALWPTVALLSATTTQLHTRSLLATVPTLILALAHLLLLCRGITWACCCTAAAAAAGLWVVAALIRRLGWGCEVTHTTVHSHLKLKHIPTWQEVAGAWPPCACVMHAAEWLHLLANGFGLLHFPSQEE